MKISSVIGQGFGPNIISFKASQPLRPLNINQVDKVNSIPLKPLTAAINNDIQGRHIDYYA